MTNDMNKTCCFTGHRPEKCKGTETVIRSKLTEEIHKAVKDGFDTFITGTAPGVDTWAAEEVLKFKEENTHIGLICAVPFKGVKRNRTPEQQESFAAILSEADYVEYICQKYTRWCFHARNKWMVGHAKRVIAVFNGTHGGTENTINYAKKSEREIVMISGAE